MHQKPFPTEPEFAATATGEAYERWLRAKVQASLDDQRPGKPHAEVMSELRKVVEAKHDADASDPMAH